MQIWNGCNAINIAGNPIKDINTKLTFLSSGSKVERWLTPPSNWPGSHLNFFSSDIAWTWWKMIDPLTSSDIWWKCGKFCFCMYSPNDACKCAINFFLSSGAKVERWLTHPTSDWPGSHVKFFSSDLAWTWWKMIDPPSQFWHLVEMWEILLLHVLSNDACKCAINLFPISWEPFENVNLLYFLL